jgi:hypothetical protein
MEEAQTVLNLSTTWAKEFQKAAEVMLSIPMTSDRFNKIIDAAFPEAKATTKLQIANRDNVVSQITQIYTGPKNVGAVGPNGWSAWNAVVEYLDHHRDATPQERALSSMDETSWVTKRKLIAQQAVMALA